MPNYQAPGVYVEEVDRGAKPLEAAPTAIAAFIGFTERLPSAQGDEREVGTLGLRPRKITSWGEYSRLYGGCCDDAYLPDAVSGFFTNGGSTCYIVPVEPGDLSGADRAALADAVLGDPSSTTGLGALDSLDDVTIVMAPDAVQLPPEALLDVQSRLIDHCETHKNRLVVLDPPPSTRRPHEVLQWRQDAAFDSPFAALYYPWLLVEGEAGQRSVPPCGHVAGVWARMDEMLGPWKAPANAIVRGITGLHHETTTEEQEDLNPEGINAIRAFDSEGFRVWGARTLSSHQSWKYINVRRLFNMVEKTIKDGTSWVVFEPNDPTTWGRVWGTLDGFLRGLWRQGAFFGTSPSDAYFIKVDSDTNPPDVINRGELVVEVGIAPVKPAEFVILRVSQKAAELT